MADNSDTENTNLMSSSLRKEKKKPDWHRFGLSREQAEATDSYTSFLTDNNEAFYQHAEGSKQNELFAEDLQLSHKPWWKANFFISEPILFGTWDGVFTSCLINLLGVVIFLRMGWIVGNTGIWLAIVVILFSSGVVLIVSLSAIGVCERCKMDGGGVYFLISHVLGGRIGGSVGVMYCFSQAAGCSLSVMGFGESIMGLMEDSNPWIARGIATAVVLLLLGINVAGVKWVIRVQLVLLVIIFLSVMDFLVGSFVHTDPENGVLGYLASNLKNNSQPDYLEGESFFTIMGLFFSTVTGILAGINMSGDLHDPFNNIPAGTLSALGVSTFLYVAIATVLGATCTRDSLQDHYMIAEKVSVIGILFLAGLYISSVSSCMGSLYGPPRVLQSIANENVIPAIKILGHGKGANKVPVYALVVMTLVILLFIIVGDVNTLAPVVTTSFLFTYSAVCYSYFALAMSYDRRQQQDARFSAKPTGNALKVESDMKEPSDYGSTQLSKEPPVHKDSFQRFATDLDKLFPERLTHRGQHHLARQQLIENSPTTPEEAVFDITTKNTEKQNIDKVTDGKEDDGDTTKLLAEPNPTASEQRGPNTEIHQQPQSWYSLLCNRWISLLGAFICIIVMFSIQWLYTLGEILCFIGIYMYIGQASPGYFPGIAEFNLYDWIKRGCLVCIRGSESGKEQYVVPPNTPAVQTFASQLTEDNEDFASRNRYHQSEIVKGENFDDYN
ncbi:solute carrier family 12 member 8-like [Argonauta hians]